MSGNVNAALSDKHWVTNEEQRQMRLERIAPGIYIDMNPRGGQDLGDPWWAWFVSDEMGLDLYGPFYTRSDAAQWQVGYHKWLTSEPTRVAAGEGE